MSCIPQVNAIPVPNDKNPVKNSHPEYLVKSVSHAILFASKGISSIFSTQSDMCVCIYMQYSSQYRQAGRGKEIKYGIAVTGACKGNLRGAIVSTLTTGLSAVQ